MATSGVRARREPPQFRRVAVLRGISLGPRMVRVTLGGNELDDFVVTEPAASVRVLLPTPLDAELVMPVWNGNEFRLADGRRPTIRTLTPVATRPFELDVDVVVHGHGPASQWAQAATPGDVTAVSGPGRGLAPHPGAPAFLLAGDETAIPALRQILEMLPTDRPIATHIEAAAPEARQPFADRPGTTVTWHDLDPGGEPGDTLVTAVRAADWVDGTHIWAAGEAAAMQRIRRHLYDEREVPRSRTTIRGYWKHGRAGDDDA